MPIANSDVSAPAALPRLAAQYSRDCGTRGVPPPRAHKCVDINTNNATGSSKLFQFQPSLLMTSCFNHCHHVIQEQATSLHYQKADYARAQSWAKDIFREDNTETVDLSFDTENNDSTTRTIDTFHDKTMQHAVVSAGQHDGGCKETYPMGDQPENHTDGFRGNMQHVVVNGDHTIEHGVNGDHMMEDGVESEQSCDWESNGTKLRTYKSTLLCCPDTYLTGLFSGFQETESDHITLPIVDREVFSTVILTYLREYNPDKDISDDILATHSRPSQLPQVITSCDFLGLTTLQLAAQHRHTAFSPRPYPTIIPQLSSDPTGCSMVFPSAPHCNVEFGFAMGCDGNPHKIVLKYHITDCGMEVVVNNVPNTLPRRPKFPCVVTLQIEDSNIYTTPINHQYFNKKPRLGNKRVTVSFDGYIQLQFHVGPHEIKKPFSPYCCGMTTEHFKVH